MFSWIRRVRRQSLRGFALAIRLLLIENRRLRDQVDELRIRIERLESRA